MTGDYGLKRDCFYAVPSLSGRVIDYEVAKLLITYEEIMRVMYPLMLN